jgi:hypothetical protein
VSTDHSAEVGRDWQAEFLESCSDLAEGTAVGEGAFAAGPALWVGRREIAHFDDELMLDVRLTQATIRLRRDKFQSDERVSLCRGRSDWLTITVGPEDAEWARRVVLEAVAANLPTAPAGLPPTGAELEPRRRFH